MKSYSLFQHPHLGLSPFVRPTQALKQESQVRAPGVEIFYQILRGKAGLLIHQISFGHRGDKHMAS